MKSDFMYSHLWFKPIMSSLIKWSHNCLILHIISKTVAIIFDRISRNFFCFLSFQIMNWILFPAAALFSFTSVQYVLLRIKIGFI